MEEVKLAPPWMIYFRKLEAFFKEDPDVNLKLDDFVIKVYVNGEKKADALRELLPLSKSFGNIKFNVNVIPANPLDMSKISVLQKALEGNEALSRIETVSGVSSNDFNFVVFQPKVVQYYNDDLSDINGLCSTLYQDLAKDIFGESDGIYFCTEKI
jgi:hypothetical protein